MQKRKGLLQMLLGTALILVLALISFTAACAKPAATSTPTAAPAPKPTATPIVLKGLTYQPTDKPLQKLLFKLAEIVKEKSKGELVIDIIGGPEVVADFDQPEAVSKGVYDIINSSFDYAKPLIGNVAYAPNIIKPSAVEQRKLGIPDVLDEVMSRANLKYLGHGQSPGPRYIYTKKTPINRIEDVAGLAIRGTGLEEEWLVSLKGNPLHLSWGDTYTAMERGLCEGFFSSGMSTVSYSLQEVAKYRTPNKHFNSTVAVLMSLGSYNRLPKNLQTALTDSMAEVEVWEESYMPQLENEALAKIEKAGVKMTEISPQEQERFRTTLAEVGWKIVMKADPNWGAKLRKLAGT